MELWRISNHQSLSGEGGRRYSARWHNAGRPVVYLAESPPGALLEVLVHYSVRDGRLPEPYTLLQVKVTRDIPVVTLKAPGGRWVRNEEGTRDVGDRWLEKRESALARVPSAVMPQTYNILFNPQHPDAVHVRLVRSEEVDFDLRLLRQQSVVRPN